MKRILLLALLISPLTFLTSCSEYKVNKQEFNDALSFKNVRYLQVDERYKEFDHVVKDFSPTVYHSIVKSIDYQEYYYHINEIDGYKRSNKDNPFEKYTPKYKDECYKTPSEECNLLEQLHLDYEIEIEDIYGHFIFKNNRYICKENDKIEIQFKGKKVISFIDHYKGDGTNATFTYQKVELKYPPEPLKS